MCERTEAWLAELDLKAGHWMLAVLQRLLFRPAKKLNPEQVRHIAVYRIGNIGDMVVALPALMNIRQAFPKAKITLITSAGQPGLPGAGEVLDSAPMPHTVDRIVSYIPSEVKSPAGLLTLKSRVLADVGPVDLFIDLPVTMQNLQRNFQEMFLACWLGARFAVGFDLLIPVVFTHAWARVHAERIPKTADWLQGLVQKYLRISAGGFNWDQGLATGLLLTHGLSTDRPLLLVNAGAKLAIKRWPKESFRKTLRLILAAQQGVQVALIGSASEHELNEEIAQDLPGTVVNLCGKLDLSDTWKLLQFADAVLSNDTGTMHMAGFCNKPVFVPMSGQWPAPLWHPPGDTLVEFRQPVACAPCFKDACPLKEQICLTAITPQEVAEKISAVLAAKTTSRSQAG